MPRVGEDRITAGIDLVGRSPSPARRMPACASSSLYFPMAARSSVLGSSPASDALVALTITMTFMTPSLYYAPLLRCSALAHSTGAWLTVATHPNPKRSVSS